MSNSNSNSKSLLRLTLQREGIGLVTIKVMISSVITNLLKDHTITSNKIGIKLLYLIMLNLGCLFSSETLNMCIYLLFLKWFRLLG